MSQPIIYSAVIPAAGVGRRFGGDLPKQYLVLTGKTIMEHTVELLLSLPQLTEIVVTVHADDSRWQTLALLRNPRIHVVTGGAERCHSVLAGLAALDAIGSRSQRVLVHDVARPCCPREDIERLMRQTAEDATGGILAVPVSDTLKRTTDDAIVETVDRSGLWAAQTPQLFDRQLLARALQASVAAGVIVTDEAQAVESLGLRPRVVEGSRNNIKVTRPDDVALATFLLARAAAAPAGESMSEAVASHPGPSLQ